MKIKWTEKKLALADFIGLFVAPVLIVEIYKAALILFSFFVIVHYSPDVFIEK
jgi:hypothetical protein